MDRGHDFSPARRWPLALLLLALGTLSWQRLGPGTVTGGAVVQRPIVVMLPPLAAPSAPESMSSAARRAPPTARRATVPAADEPLVCGWGPVRASDDDPYSLQRVPAAARSAALASAEARLLAHPDPQVRAAALLIGARGGSDGAGRLEQLIRMTLASQDAVVYTLALEACAGRGDSEQGPCVLLQHGQWAQLDPDNAQAWLSTAAVARQRGDGIGEAQAMERAAHARRSEARAGLLPVLVERALPPSEPPELSRTLALAQSWSAQAGWSLQHGGQAQAWCGDDVLDAPQRLATCEALAVLLVEHSDRAEDLAAGLAIGTRLGWPEARLQALREELEALDVAAEARSIGVDFGCAAVEQQQGWMRELAARGELQALRDRVARSGRSIREWSRLHQRDYGAAVAAAAAAGASAPSVHSEIVWTR